MNTSKPKKEKVLTDKDLLKYEIAAELGLADKVRERGWKALSARESGQIGGLMNSRLKNQGQDQDCGE